MGAMIGTAILALNAVTRSNVDTNLRDRFVLGSRRSRSDPGGPKVALDSSAGLRSRTAPGCSTPPATQVLGPEAGRRVQAVVDDLGTVTEQDVTDHARGGGYLAGPVTIGGAPTPGRGVLVVVAESLKPYETRAPRSWSGSARWPSWSPRARPPSRRGR